MVWVSELEEGFLVGDSPTHLGIHGFLWRRIKHFPPLKKIIIEEEEGNDDDDDDAEEEDEKGKEYEDKVKVLIHLSLLLKYTVRISKYGSISP